MKKGNKGRQNRSSKKATEKKDEVRSRDIWGILPNPRSKKDNQENCCTQLSPCVNHVFQGWENCKILTSQDFYAGNNFRNCHLKKEYFAGI